MKWIEILKNHIIIDIFICFHSLAVLCNQTKVVCLGLPPELILSWYTCNGHSNRSAIQSFPICLELPACVWIGIHLFWIRNEKIIFCSSGLCSIYEWRKNSICNTLLLGYLFSSVTILKQYIYQMLDTRKEAIDMSEKGSVFLYQKQKMFMMFHKTIPELMASRAW